MKPAFPSMDEIMNDPYYAFEKYLIQTRKQLIDLTVRGYERKNGVVGARDSRPYTSGDGPFVV
jgi:hypothetical protein